jgi:hypothetical protein
MMLGPSCFSPGCGSRQGGPEALIVSRIAWSAESLVATMASLRMLFLDGEVIDGESDDVSSARPGFAMRPSGGNNRLAWVPFSALKYCKFSPAAAVRSGRPEDPRGQVGLPKLVLRFNDGEVMRGYKDEVFAHDGNCLNVMLWDQVTRSLCRYIVPYSALKAVFFVEQWDSREGVERSA